MSLDQEQIMCRPFDQARMLADLGPLAFTVPVGVERISWPDPTPEQLNDPLFQAIWTAIKSWDIAVPGAYGGYCGASGNHVRNILEAVQAVRP